jgi:hypothetical protein
MVRQLPSATEAVVSRHPRLSIDTSSVLRLDIPADFREAAADTHARAILVGWYVEVGLIVLGQEGAEQLSLARREDFLLDNWHPAGGKIGRRGRRVGLHLFSR